MVYRFSLPSVGPNVTSVCKFILEWITGNLILRDHKYSFPCVSHLFLSYCYSEIIIFPLAGVAQLVPVTISSFQTEEQQLFFAHTDSPHPQLHEKYAFSESAAIRPLTERTITVLVHLEMTTVVWYRKMVRSFILQILAWTSNVPDTVNVTWAADFCRLASAST